MNRRTRFIFSLTHARSIFNLSQSKLCDRTLKHLIATGPIPTATKYLPYGASHGLSILKHLSKGVASDTTVCYYLTLLFQKSIDATFRELLFAKLHRASSPNIPALIISDLTRPATDLFRKAQEVFVPQTFKWCDCSLDAEDHRIGLRQPPKSLPLTTEQDVTGVYHPRINSPAGFELTQDVRKGLFWPDHLDEESGTLHPLRGRDSEEEPEIASVAISQFRNSRGVQGTVRPTTRSSPPRAGPRHAAVRAATRYGLVPSIRLGRALRWLCCYGQRTSGSRPRWVVEGTYR